MFLNYFIFYYISSFIYYTASELYNNVLNIYTTQYSKITKAQKTRVRI